MHPQKWSVAYSDIEGEARGPEKVGEYTLQTHDHVFVDIAKASMDVSSTEDAYDSVI